MVRRTPAIERRSLGAEGARNRKRTEEALRESKERLLAVVSNAPIILFALDREGVFTLSEGKALAALGLKPGEIVGRSVFDIYGDIPGVEASVGRALAGEAFTATMEVAGLTFECQCSPLRNHNGEVNGVIGVATDITEHKRAEEAVRESEERYRRLVELSPDPIVVHSEGRAIYVNPAAVRLFGATNPEDLLGKRVLDFVHPGCRETTAERVRQVREQEEQAPLIEAKLLRLDGRAIDVELASAQVAYLGTAVTQHVIRDVTEHKWVDEALRESEERFRSLSESAPIGIFLTDSEGNCTYANPRLLSIAGLTLEESLGSGWTKVIHPDDRQAVLEEVSRAPAEGRDFAREFRLLTGEGELRSVRVHSTPMVSADGEQIGRVGTLEDITERARAEAALRESEGRYRLLVENVSDVIWTTDLNLRYTYLSSVMPRRGYSLEEVMAQTVEEALTPASYEVAKETLAEELAIEKMEDRDLSRSRTLELEMNCRDGSTVWQEVRMTFLRDPDGQPVGILGVSRDISERKRAEEALRESEERYRSLIETSPDAITLTDSDGNIIMSNRQAVALHGCESAEEMIGRSAFDFVAPEDRARAAENTKKTAEAGSVRNVEYTLLRKDGTSFSAELSASLIVDAEGKPNAFIGVVRDITERKRMEETLRESEERYRRLVEVSPDAIVVHCEGRLVYANPATADLYGASNPRELIGKPVLEFIHPDYRETVLNRLRQLLEEGKPTELMEIEFLRVDGQVLYAEVAGVPITYLGKPAALSIVRDITERKRAEEALQESEKRYRLLAENVSDAIWTLDMSLKYTYVSPSFTRLRGYTAEEMMNSTVSDTLTPASVELARKVLAEELAIEKSEQKDPFRSRTLELEVKCKDSSTVWAEVRVTFLRDSDGQPTGILGVSRDITERKRAEEALRQSEQEFRLVFEDAKDAILWADPKTGLIARCNKAAEGLLEKERGEIIGQHQTVVHPPQKAEYYAAMFRRHIEQEGYADDEAEVITKSGRTVPVHVSASVVSVGGKPIIQGIFHDISERKQMEDALRESEERYRLLAENASDVIWTMDLSLRYTYVSPSIVRMRGYSPEELVGETVQETLTPDSLELARKTLAEELAGERAGRKDQFRSRTLELEMYHKDGSTVWTEVKMTFLRNAEGQPVGILGVTRDISERKKAEETIRFLAYHDTLTSLPNATLFKDRLDVALAQARRSRQMIAVMLLDLDRFKLVNDTVGHAGGDQLLRSVGEHLTNVLREVDTVARVGGDEFALLVPGIAQVDAAVDVAERVLEAVKEPRVIAGHEFHITTSIGIALYPTHGRDAETLLRNADTAMYRAREQGSDAYLLFMPSMNANITERAALESQLRHAFERNEFLVHYQPQVDVSNRRIVGMEALVRWQHSERGLVYPDEFIPLAEDTGLIVPLGEWVLRTACIQNKAWQEAGLPHLRLAVNLSARQFQPTLTDLIRRVLKDTGLDPQYLELEITEGTAMRDLEFTASMLSSLRDMGVTISIDDFGTGYSSLSYLKRFPIDAVKVDRTFVRDMTVDPDDAAIVAAIIGLAQSLNLRSIAEGVEKEEQLTFLQQRGCHEMQGYLFSPAVPAEEFERILKDGSVTLPLLQDPSARC